MAIVVNIAPTVLAVSGLETQFEASGPFVLYGDGFAEDEWCSLDRLGPSGTYIRACNEKGVIKVGANPNMIYVDAPGSYQLRKRRTRIAASVGIQSPHTLELLINTDEYPELKLTELLSATTGIWYDPQDLTTLYQDAQGTLPVYRPGSGAVDPPVGLLLDKSLGLELGPELASGVGFTPMDTSTGATPAYDQVTGELSNSTVGFSSINPYFLLTQSGSFINTNTFYRVRVKFSGNLDPITNIALIIVGPSAVFEKGGISGDSIRASGGEYEYIGINTAGTNPGFRISTDGTTTWDGLFVESISIREIKGYHAYQTTTTARPTLSGRYNLLTATETLSTQSVTTAATAYTLRFEGTGTITLSGAATGTYTEGTHTITCTGGALTCTVAGTVTKADLRVKRDGSSLPAYQSVTDANTYDTVGFPLFLKRNKVDDDLIVQAPAITGAWAHGTINGPMIGTVDIPAGEYYPFGDGPALGLPDCTQWIAIDGTLSASEQAVFERYVYSKARQLIDVDQFGSVSSFANYFRRITLYASVLQSLDVSRWDTSNAITFTSSFYLNHNLVLNGTVNISSKCQNINAMFFANKSMQSYDISGWDCTGLLSAYGVFSGCVSLKNVTVGSAFNNTPCTNFTNAFNNTNLNQASIDAILVSINTAGTSNGTFNQSGGSAPSAAGEAAITAMRSRGWTVKVTGGF